MSSWQLPQIQGFLTPLPLLLPLLGALSPPPSAPSHPSGPSSGITSSRKPFQLLQLDPHDPLSFPESRWDVAICACVSNQAVQASEGLDLMTPWVASI